MTKKTYMYIFASIALIILVGLFFLFNSLINNNENKKTASVINDYKNAEYIIEGRKIKLVNGESEISDDSGSASKIMTKYFGNEVFYDLNGDGRKDVAFLLTQSTGGSGTFYYVVAALNTESGYVGSNAFYLGDRIAPQTTEMSQDLGQEGVVVVNYVDRNSWESFNERPTLGKSVWIKFDPSAMKFNEIARETKNETSEESKG